MIHAGYSPKYFKIQELVPREIWDKYKDASWQFLNPPMVSMLDVIRIRFGKMMINNWADGGGFNLCGYRPFDCKIGAQLSRHKFGGAFDIHPYSATVEEIKLDIMKHRIQYMYLNRIEDVSNWLHIDNYPTFSCDIQIFKP